jgi:hypothetical protein
MRPTYANLLAARGGQFTCNVRTPIDNSSGVAVSRSRVTLAGGTDLTIDAGDDDAPGMWVNYLEGRASYGIASGGETWSASGPFSGCHIVIGKKAGSVFVAHLAQQSGSTADADWQSRGWSDGQVWARWKVPMPSQTSFSGSIVFVDWSRGDRPDAISVVRVDVETRSMGGMNGRIFDVVHVINPE